MQKKISQPELWAKVENFSFEKNSDEYGFTTRLATEQSWTIAFTEAAILEYKKFMYLVAVGQKMLSPSVIVDEVWHLHLLFSKSYKKFTALLGKEIEHTPSLHNERESSIYAQAFAETKTAYQAEFGEMPTLFWARKDMISALDLPQSRYSLPTFVLLLLPSVAIFFLVSAQWWIDLFYSWHNPRFLAQYILMGLFLIACTILLGEALFFDYFRKQHKHWIFKNLTPLELLYLQHGNVAHSAHAVVNDLYKHDMIQRTEVDKKFEYSLVAKNNKPRNGYEAIVLERLAKDKNGLYKLNEAEKFAQLALSGEAIKSAFRQTPLYIFGYLGLLLPILLWFGMGVFRLGLGASNGQPFLYLLLTLFVAVLITWRLLAWLSRLPIKNAIEAIKSAKIKASGTTRLIKEDMQWAYFLVGAAAMSLSFDKVRPVYAGNVEAHGGCGSSGCGGGDGGGCGGGCGGCGGGGD